MAAGRLDGRHILVVGGGQENMTVGQYHMVAFALNSLGVEQDEGLQGLPG